MYCEHLNRLGNSGLTHTKASSSSMLFMAKLMLHTSIVKERVYARDTFLVPYKQACQIYEKFVKC